MGKLSPGCTQGPSGGHARRALARRTGFAASVSSLTSCSPARSGRPAASVRAPGLERAVLIRSAGPVSSLMGPGLLFKMFIKMAQLFKHKINEDDPLTLL